jgi:riboflavin kinase/FMN adenylyltransferase
LRYISSVREKAERCGALGIDLVYFMRFNASVASMSALEFIEKVLVQSLAARHIVVGEDVGVGRGRQGDLEFLRKHLPAYGIEVHSVPKLMIGGVKAGSRKIREVIQCGEVDTAAELMGAPFTISARVGHGDKRGSAIGFPTANIAIANRLIPKSGVYACLVTVAGITHKAVANIGTRPTFSGRGERLEVHLLDFNPRSLYGVRIHVAFRSRLRSEQKFSSVDELTRQIALDIQRAREVLNDG